MKKAPYRPSPEEAILKAGLVQLPEKINCVENAVGYVNGAICERMQWKRIVIASIPKSPWSLAAGMAMAVMLCIVFAGIKTGYIDISEHKKAVATISSIIFPGKSKEEERVKKAALILDSAKNHLYQVSKMAKDTPFTNKTGILDSISATIDSCRKTLLEPL
jgi:hypothetical protein